MAERSFLDLKVAYSGEGVFLKFLEALHELNFTVGNVELLQIVGNKAVKLVELGSPYGFEETLGRLREITSRDGGIKLEEISDSLRSWHEGGKLEVSLTHSFRSFLDLRKIYTPGVAEISRLIEERRELADELTWRGRTAVVISDGSAVLGLGDVGPEAALPVMEGKAALIKLLGGVNAVPLVLAERDPDKLVEIIVSISPTYGVIQLEDISAPRCFYIVDRLDELQKEGKFDVPFFHDDQHGTAAVVLAALIRSLEFTGRKETENLKVVVLGAGAASSAVVRLLLYWADRAGVKMMIRVFDSKGVLFPGRGNMNPYKAKLAELTNPEGEVVSLEEAFEGADVFIGLSRPGLIGCSHIRKMAKDPVILSLANPQPEITPEEALKAGAAVAADGRTVNNALVFPGLIRGVLSHKIKRIDSEVLLRAAEAVVEAAGEDFVPSQLDRNVHSKVADKVGQISDAGL